ncbi:MAG: DUF721 domain-containing protein [Chitinophagaceae bacterium]|nr:MAG: DUF721 domain-containing protein [Chitinophagaceae bacterium]
MGEMSLKDALGEFLNNSKMKSGLQAVQLESVWEEIMGKTIARYTDKLQILQTTLYISTTVAPLKNELIYQKENIIRRVNEALGSKVISDVIKREPLTR